MQPLNLISKDARAQSTSESNDPANRRFGRRQPIYLGDALKVVLTTQHGIVTGNLVDLSINGVGLAVTNPEQFSLIEIGQDIELEVKLPAPSTAWPLLGTIVHTRHVSGETSNYLHVGISYVGTATTQLSRKKLAGFRSYKCPEMFRPLAYTNEAVLYGDNLHFQITEVQANGVKARTSLRNLSIFPGQRFTLNVLVPLSGEHTVQAQVLHVEAPTNEPTHLQVEIAFENPSAELLAAIGEFVLLTEPDVDVSVLRREGFFLDTIFKAIRITYPSSIQDWDAILRLRLQAYQSVGKFLDRTSHEEMREPFDAYSRQIIARVGGRVVGSARVVFCGSNLERSEHSNMGLVIPSAIVTGGFVEFSRFCCAPEFRGADIFIALMRQAALIAAQSPYAYILANCNSDLWQIYKKLSFKKIGPAFTAYGRNDCSLIAMKIADVKVGRGADFVTWNQVVHPVIEFVQERGITNSRWHPWNAFQRLLSPVIDRLRIRKNFNRFINKKKRSTNTARKGI